MGNRHFLSAMDLELEAVEYRALANPDQGLLSHPALFLIDLGTERHAWLGLGLEWVFFLSALYLMFAILRALIFRPLLHDWAYGRNSRKHR